MSNDIKYFEKLFQDFDHAKKSTREVPVFKRAVAEQDVSKDLDKRFKKILQNTNNNIDQAMELIAEEIESVYPDNKDAKKWLNNQKAKTPVLDKDSSEQAWYNTKEIEFFRILAQDPIDPQDYVSWMNNYIVKRNPTAMRGLKEAQTNPSSENVISFFNDIETIAFNLLNQKGENSVERLLHVPGAAVTLAPSSYNLHSFLIRLWKSGSVQKNWWHRHRFTLRSALAAAYKLPLPKQESEPQTTPNQKSTTPPTNEEVVKANLSVQQLMEEAKKAGIVDPVEVRDYILKRLTTPEKKSSIKSFIKYANSQNDLIRKMIQDPTEFTEAYNKVYKKTYSPKQIQRHWEAQKTKDTGFRPTPSGKDTAGPPTPTKPTFKVYEVKEGDTLNSIVQNSKVPGLTWEHLVALNKIKDPNYIIINQKIQIPTKVDKNTPRSSGQPQKSKAKPQQAQPQSQDPTKDEYGFPKTKPQPQQAQPQSQQVKPQQAQAPVSKAPEKPKQNWIESFTSNTEALVNEKNLGREGNPAPLLEKARQDLQAIAATGNIAAYTQAFRFFVNKNILVDVAQHHRKFSKKGIVAEDLIALNRAFAQRKYTQGTLTALNELTNLLQQDKATWETHEQLLLALRKLVLAKAKQAKVVLDKPGLV